MWILGRLTRTMRRHLYRVSWLAVLVALLLHLGVTWLLLWLAGEDAKLVAPQAFPYYYMTTATTIGYGDLSPQTTAGRMVVALLLMPGAVALFAAVLTKTATALSTYWKRHLMGRMDYREMSGHTVLVGWHGAGSERLVQLLLSDTATDDEGLVLIAQGLDENPLPEHMRYVAAGCYAEVEAYARAAVASAARIVIDTADDDQALAAVMAVMSYRPAAHVVAHFEAASPMQLVRSLYPSVECTRPMSAEIIARAAQDPGSSLLTQDLLSTATGVTQFSLPLPAGGEACHFGALAAAFKAQSALLIGFRPPGSAEPRLNPSDATAVPAGALLYYLALQRLDPASIDWRACAARSEATA